MQTLKKTENSLQTMNSKLEVLNRNSLQTMNCKLEVLLNRKQFANYEL